MTATLASPRPDTVLRRLFAAAAGAVTREEALAAYFLPIFWTFHSFGQGGFHGASALHGLSRVWRVFFHHAMQSLQEKRNLCENSGARELRASMRACSG